MLTFGLLSPSKGIEYAIDAVALLKDRYPDILYVIAGIPHPALESLKFYNNTLEKVSNGSLSDHVYFYPEHLSVELIDVMLSTADLYVTPYLNMNQQSSGTLTFALRAGVPCVSTQYTYAKEMLQAGLGFLAEPNSGQSLATATQNYLDLQTHQQASLRDRLRCRGVSFDWKAIASTYHNLLRQKPTLDLGSADLGLVSYQLSHRPSLKDQEDHDQWINSINGG